MSRTQVPTATSRRRDDRRIPSTSLDSFQSVYRERLIEHLVLGQLLRYAWLYDAAALEVSQPAIDRAGHDVVLEAHGITRHVQFKSSAVSAKTSRQTIHLDLGTKPAGCVVWVRFDPKTLDLGPYLFFGGAPGRPLPDITKLALARHTKGNAQGIKLARPNLRIVPIAKFLKIPSVADLYTALFGPSLRST